jgi:Flp pilus assembly protein TadD
MRAAQFVVFVCCVQLLLLPAKADAQYYERSYAVVIGIDHYANPKSFPGLKYAVKDAEAMAALLARQGFTVIPLYESQATKAAILSAMQDNLAPKLGARDRVFVFFSGHGQTEKLGGKERGYIVPYDGGKSSSLISMEELQQQSSFMGTAKHQLFVMDSCFGGRLAATKPSIVDPNTPNYLKNMADRIARLVFTAGGADQEVVDGGPKGHSVFVDALLEAIDDGLADLNGDGYVTSSELVAYVTPRAGNVYQTPAPGVLPEHQSGEFLFRNPKGPNRPVLAVPVPVVVQKKNGETTAERHVALGDTRWAVGDWDGAAAEYRAAIRLKPNYAEAHQDLGVALIMKSDTDGGIQELREAVRLNPNDPDAHYLLGIGYSRKNNWDQVIQEQREAIRLKPDNPKAHQVLGKAFARKEDWDASAPELRASLRSGLDDFDTRFLLGFGLLTKGDADAAAAEFRAAIRLKPDEHNAHTGLGMALEEKGDLNEASAEFREAIRLDSNDSNARRHLASILERKR